jgi:ABC-type antimicrobial peptide transport system permease subunit
MSRSAGFPINDLFRRRFQTGLTITTLALSVASTLFLLLFSTRLGAGITLSSNILTLGLTSIFTQFIVFVGILIFVVGAILTSFIVFLMMTQRTRDFGLIKAAGCPNSLIAGYFMTELLIVTFAGCIIGVVFGFLADFVASSTIFMGYSLPNWWFAPLVFVVFLVLSLFFGLQPLFRTAKMSAIQALSSANYYGLLIEGRHKTLVSSALTWRVAARSLVRRLHATSRIVILLSIMFTLLTVSVAGGIIANETTSSWIQKTIDKETIIVAHSDICNQYKLKLLEFTGIKINGEFNYSDSKYSISSKTLGELNGLYNVESVNAGLFLSAHVREISNFTVIDGKEVSVGDSRENDAVVIGVIPHNDVSQGSIKGRDLELNEALEAVIGDSISQTMYSPDARRHINISDPMVQGIKIGNSTFRIVGVCVDSINNGNVVYVPLEGLMKAVGVVNPNLFFVKIDDSVNREEAINSIENIVKGFDSNLEVLDLGLILEQNVGFLNLTWHTIMLLPFLALISATLCLVGYMMLAVDEQRQEFAMLRAVGAKPKIIINISAIQSIIVLFSSFGVGISFGVIITVMILMENPLVTTLTLAVISVWLVSALITMYLLSLYPAFRLAKTPILKIIS